MTTLTVALLALQVPSTQYQDSYNTDYSQILTYFHLDKDTILKLKSIKVVRYFVSQLGSAPTDDTE